ncbi:MAG: hypothetical protein KBB01_05780 [Candidatus Omnitrophica bacterium]|jgi:hypothetical protein|nr:hypothetical protein [Candidatus Omnitrophota bacterium]
MIRRFDFPHDRFRNRIKQPLKNTTDQQKNIKLLENCSKKLKLELKNFTSDNNLELYFDIYRDDQDICYIYKGWEDSGFRIGELIEFNKYTPDFKERFYEIFKICSDRLITIGVEKQEEETSSLFLEIGIYKSGFNAKVLKEAIQNLEDALIEIQPSL